MVLIVPKLPQIPVDLTQPFLDPFHPVADHIQQDLCRELGRHHGIEEGAAVHRDGDQYRGIGRKESAWLVGDDNHCRPCFPGHLHNTPVHRRIPGEAEYDQAVFLCDAADVVDGADGTGRSCFHIWQHMLQIKKKIIPKAGIPAAGDNVFTPGPDNKIGRLLEGSAGIVGQDRLQVLGGIVDMELDVLRVAA